MPQIVIPDDEPAVLVPSQAYRKLDGHHVRAYDTRPETPDDLVARIRDAEVVINIRSSCRFDKAVLEACPSLRMISIWGTGTDNVDLQGAAERGVRVTNTPAVAKNAVAEHTLMLMLAAGRRIIEVDRRVRLGEWPRAMITELHGKTLGLIGLGAIGTQVARLGKGIGMNVVAWTFHPSDELAAEIGFEFVSLDQLLRLSDVVSVHVRQSGETTGMISTEQFEMMKSTAIFINTARGAIVNERALVAALRSGAIAAAGLDVFGTEPLDSATPFSDLSNVVLTPHSAGISPETTEAGLAMAVDNVLDFLAGTPSHVVA
jgi:D-3-phosphoglycerate dehydrogenase